MRQPPDWTKHPLYAELVRQDIDPDTAWQPSFEKFWSELGDGVSKHQWGDMHRSLVMHLYAAGWYDGGRDTLRILWASGLTKAPEGRGSTE